MRPMLVIGHPILAAVYDNKMSNKYFGFTIAKCLHKIAYFPVVQNEESRRQLLIGVTNEITENNIKRVYLIIEVMSPTDESHFNVFSDSEYHLIKAAISTCSIPLSEKETI
ncbi:hypothetical protein TNCT_148771 [Trichonephila clavata]|uniref:Uncharacterized protein n=1 Tax=Trichonephila clavata TaxID=2740835 RepID=A0A8X6KDF1_TRICU|nr:hypothetical protein TNCT_148771 [Trichonephila clavata]